MHQVIDALIVCRALGVERDIVAVVGVAGAIAERLVQIDEAGARERCNRFRSGDVIEIARDDYRGTRMVRSRGPLREFARLQYSNRYPADRFRTVGQVRNVKIEQRSVVQPEPPAHRDPVVGQAVAMAGDLGDHLDLRPILD